MAILKWILKTVKSLESFSIEERNLYDEISRNIPGDGVLITEENKNHFTVLANAGLISRMSHNSDRAVIILHNYIITVIKSDTNTQEEVHWFKHFILAPDFQTAYHHAEFIFKNGLVGVVRNDVSKNSEFNFDNQIDRIEKDFLGNTFLYLIKDYNPLIILEKQYFIDKDNYDLIPGDYDGELGLVYEQCQVIDDQRSASVGDIIEINNTLFIILPVGFAEVEWNTTIDLTSLKP